ncbi:hypothetical protein SAMN04488544_0740 [Microlunatus sagamiharensis]|uniref:DUF1684 domain-containing protein n=1 Tax=Microlunatus sagamiharensis TaxID=546874 RepID=A0A1H2LS05_9ACTN|nr:DUF1684 domain-containing protein [Microlunatus sagamiharensis]SDU83793.1 hypothetical protein SAMN04488544_0740 [Microlunatus sagamiharensis]
MTEPALGARTALELADWRRRVASLYAAVRAEADPRTAHELWRRGRDTLFAEHPQSALRADDPLRSTGLPLWPYDPAYRFELPVLAPPDPDRVLELPSGETGITTLRPVGVVELPDPVGATVTVWWLEQYAGGLFLPLRDGTAGVESYGGGRYLLDTAKGADLGAAPGREGDRLVVDLNFLYHPSCRYDDAWLCPLAPPDNTVPARVEAGERMR